MAKCPWSSCGGKAHKVIYAGFPMKMCDDCSTLWGFWAIIPALYFHGYLFIYEESYLKGLWEWLTYAE
ncbi:MAG: hypothetical protein PHY09_18425 [Desulfuromonadaceae bacterium]|nr:hypothetical protein [Desulfuromonadaceae bacterium]MDD5107553.1 hypothetical protein [Desulfuromonadaceae bacterium]